MITSKISLAMQKAKEWHGNQEYGEGKSYYEHHILPVFYLISDKSSDCSEQYREHLLCVALLHDVLEDTSATYDEISRLFGVNIALAVSLLSDVDGKNRRERKLKTYHRIRMSPESVMVKIVDRLVNMRNCEENNPSLLKMYLREHDCFYAALWSPSHAYQEWWKELEDIYERNRI